MKERLTGVMIAVACLLIGSRLYYAGYERGKHEERTRMTTELMRNHLAYWRVSGGKAEVKYRCVPKVNQTCVKYGRSK